MQTIGDNNQNFNSGNTNKYSPKFNSKQNVSGEKGGDAILMILGVVAAIIIGVLGFFMMSGFAVACLVDYLYPATNGILWSISIIVTIIVFYRCYISHKEWGTALKWHMIISLCIALILGIFVLIYNGDNSIVFTARKMIAFANGSSAASIENERARSRSDAQVARGVSDIEFKMDDTITLDKLLALQQMRSDQREVKILKMGFGVHTKSEYPLTISRDTLKDNRFYREDDYGQHHECVQLWSTGLIDYSTDIQQDFANLREEISDAKEIKLVKDTSTKDFREIEYRYGAVTLQTGWFQSGPAHYYISIF